MFIFGAFYFHFHTVFLVYYNRVMASSSVTISSETSTSKSPKKCGLCDTNPSKYCCPRCSILYCSLDCYKSEKHADCSEDFYKQCVNDQLAGDYADEESRAKIIDILKRMKETHSDDAGNLDGLVDQLENGDDEAIDSDDEVYVDLKDRIKGLNLDDADAVWNALTETERNEFEALLNQGTIEDLIPQWEPWWSYHKKEKLVEEVDDKADDEEKENLGKCPALKQVQILSSLTSVQPNPAIRFNIANCLASYVFVARYFNGDLEGVEPASYLLNICSNLDNGTNFDDPVMAVEAVAQRCLQSDLIQTDEESLDVMRQDIFQILEGPSKQNIGHYCKCALSHMHTIFTDAKKLLKSNEKETRSKEEFSRKFPENTTEHLPKLEVSKVKMSLKKLEYYLAFLDSCDEGVKEEIK